MGTRVIKVPFQGDEKMILLPAEEVRESDIDSWVWLTDGAGRWVPARVIFTPQGLAGHPAWGVLENRQP